MNNIYELLAPFYDEWQVATYSASSLASYLEQSYFFYNEQETFQALDLGCGTGEISRALAQAGHKLMGVDNSPSMLACAAANSWDLSPEQRPFYVEQDLADLDLATSFDFIYATFDVFNHFSATSLAQIISKMSTYLRPGGLFFTDLYRESYLAEVLGQNLFYELGAEEVILWQNNYQEGCNQISIIYFQLTASGLYERHEASLEEYYHDAEEFSSLLAAAGLSLLEARPVPEELISWAQQRQLIWARKEA